MSDALINGLAGAGGGIIAQLITYPLQTVICLFNSSGSLIFYIRIFLDIYIYCCCQVNTRQQTERNPKKEKRKLGTIEQMIQVYSLSLSLFFSFFFFSCCVSGGLLSSLIPFMLKFCFMIPIGCEAGRVGQVVWRLDTVPGWYRCIAGEFILLAAL